MDELGELGIAGLSYDGYGCPGRTSLLDGFVTLELARTDPSMATLLGVHAGLAMGSTHRRGSEELVRMLGNITVSLCMAARLSRLADAGRMSDAQTSPAKAFCTTKMRETVGWAREPMGANGIPLEFDVDRFVADAEAIHSSEGTRERNTLIVGRASTGLSAFV